MREMKDSGVEWIGEIPKDKTVLRNKYNFRYEKGKLPASTNLEKTGFPYIGASDLDSEDEYSIYTDDLELPDAKYDDLLVLWDGARAGLCGTHKIGKISSTVVRIRGNETIYPPFLYWYYKGFESFMFQSVNGTTIPHMNRKYIEMMGWINWTLPEQHRIADCLDEKCTKIDTIIAKQQKIIEKLKAYKLSMITETVTKGLNPDVAMKDSGIEWMGEIPAHWGKMKLKYATKIMRGKFNHRPRNDPDYYDGNYPFVQTGDVARANKYIETYSQTLNELGYSVSKEFPKGSICLTIAANVGDVSILGFNACFPDSIVGFIPQDIIEQNYLYYVLKSMKLQFLRKSIISTQLNLNIEIIKEEFIPVAPINEQANIVKNLEKRIEQLDKAIEIKQQLMNKCVAYKKSLIYEVVTGKKEV